VIRLVYSNRTEELLRALAGDLARAGRGPFERVPLVVPNPQIEIYVKLGVARENGIAAHIETTYLRGHLAAIVAASAPDVALVDRATLEGELLSLFHDERRLGAGALGPVRAYLGAGGDAPDARDLRRAQLAAELATLFDEYAFARPELLRAWRDGRTIQGAGAPDDEKRATEAWQRALWLALHGRGGAFEARGRAEGKRYLDLPGFFAGVGPRDLQTPNVTYVFGISYVARLYREVFAALGRAGDVFIYALNPCREFWEDLDDRRASRARAAERARFPRRRAAEQLSLLPATEAAPPVDDPAALVLWARPGRENIALLNDLAECDFVPRFADPLAEPVTVLAQLQHDILDRVPARVGPARLELGDDSITVQPCPDPRRELETIAAAIWKMMRPGLRFTDVAIVVPPSAADTYLPLAAAVLREASDLPHTIVDAPATRESRVLEAVGLLLALPTGPLGRQDLLRLVMHPSVAGRFPDADPRDWLALAEELDIVHGADRGDHAGTYVEGDRFNWDQGLRRLALGAFLAGRRSGDDRAFDAGGERYLPEELPPERQASAQAFGLLARALIGFATRARDATQTIAAWMADLRRELAATLVAREPEDEAALARVLGELQRLEAVAPADLRVRYRIVHELVRAALAALPARGGRYLTQGVTVSTFLPMRAVPFAAVFMVGMGEGAFPAPERARELDLRGKDHRVPGDVTVREQDQYMFLETLLCARERVTISYVDRDAVSGEARGPSSTVLELLDMLRDGYLRGGDASAVKRDAPPLRRHEDDATCAVVPAAARERRAARLGASLRAATDGLAPPDWAALRALMGGDALASVGPAVAWVAPPPAASRRRRGERVVVTLAQLVRFLQCPLQGSARALLPIGDDDAEEIAEASFREHEDFEILRPRATSLLRRVLVDAFANDAAGADAAIDAVFARALEVAALDGTFPVGVFGAATRRTHRGLLGAWRDGLLARGALTAPLAPLHFGQAPEGLAHATIVAPLELALDLPDGPVRAALHGATWPVTAIDGVSTTVLASLSRTKGGNNGRDILAPWIDHLVLSATGRAAGDPRFVVVLRPDVDATECIALLPVSRERSAALLTSLARQMLERVHAYFLPCEGVLGWRKKSPAPDLTDYIQALRIDNWTRFTSDWGPIPNAKDYPLAPEDEARRMVDERFGLLFESCEDLNPRAPGKKPGRAT
jgi:exodeoxyribonuclease V gamma subunit